MKTLFPALCLLILLGVSGCQTTSSTADFTPRLIVEVSEIDTPRAEIVPVTMRDGSTLTIPVSPYPVLGAEHILRADVVDVDLGRAIRLTLSRRGQVELFQASGFHPSYRLLLLVGSKVVGIRRIDGVMNDPHYFTFLVIPDEEAPDLVLSINEMLKAYHD